MHGLRSLRFKSCQRAGHSGERSVIVINNESPFIHRQLAQRVSLIGAGDSQLSNVAYAAREARDERNVHHGNRGRQGESLCVFRAAFPCMEMHMGRIRRRRIS